MKKRMHRICLALLLPALAAVCQEPPYSVRANYTKHEFRIPMRDGTKLFTSVYVPKDKTKKYPILLNRTPYSVGPYGPDLYRTNIGPSDKIMKDGYIIAYQDVRGRYMSEGEWVEVRPHKPSKLSNKDFDESTDTYDSIDWLVKNLPNNNGNVGMWGISYPGFYVAAGMIDSHPALKAASPQAPIGDYFMGDDSFHNGAFMLGANFGFYSAFAPRTGGPAPPPKFREQFDYGTPDAYEFFLKLGPLANANEYYFKHKNPYWSMNLEHQNYDEFWRSRGIQHHLKNVKTAVMTVGGWFDAEDLAGPLNVYRKTEKANPGIQNMIVMGPWTHGSWSRGDGNKVGNVDFATNTSAYYRDNIEAPFFEYFLKGKGDGKFKEAYMFETGRNEWHAEDTWPPSDAKSKTLYFHESGKLTFDAPTVSEGFDEYVSDPAHPVPYLGYPASGMTRDYMTDDQRFASKRPDVLVFQTEPLEDDLSVTGPIRATLHLSTTGTDSDFVVKLIDVYPPEYPTPDPPAGNKPFGFVTPMGGYQQLVRGEPFRGRFRNSFERPEAFTPGKPTKVEYEMPDIYHTFRRGHRVMVQVQSSWFPLIDRNPQKFVDIPNAKPSDFQKATQRVFRNRVAPSGLTILVR
jgi:putative CocE/NonD family hydrolase